VFNLETRWDGMILSIFMFCFEPAVKTYITVVKKVLPVCLPHQYQSDITREYLSRMGQID
jgi:hypothetical protein